MLRVLISEDIPSHNKGEGALFFGIAECTKVLGEVKLSVLSTSPDYDRKVYESIADIIDARKIVPGHMVTNVGSFFKRALNYVKYICYHIYFVLCYALFGNNVNHIFKSSYWDAHLNSDLVICGHDSSWSSVYHYISIMTFTMLKTPVVVLGATIVPPDINETSIKSRVSRYLTIRALERCTQITLRDNLSLSRLKRAGLKNKNVEVLPDVALVMQSRADMCEDVLAKYKIPEQVSIWGVAFSRRILKAAFDAYQEDEGLERACSEIANVLDRIIERINCAIIFMPHCIGPSGNLDDRVIADRIIGKLVRKDNIINIKDDYDPRVIRALCGKLDFSFGTRLHFAIDSFAMQVPTLLLAQKNDIRCKGVVGEIIGGDYIYPIEDIESNHLFGTLLRLWSTRDIRVQEIQELISEVKDRAKRHSVYVKKAVKQAG